ncbi:MAG: hypothetical protein Q4G26_09280, partial [Paracoccus sp. (in: a-proteobacteria)]|nr:hypothetical protein [Paracoccus sp. (in: a-proteobacteria)]
MAGFLDEGQSPAADLALDRFRRNFDPQAALFAGDPASLPAHWRGYVDARQAERLACLRAEMAVLRDYLPE